MRGFFPIHRRWLIYLWPYSLILPFSSTDTMLFFLTLLRPRLNILLRLAFCLLFKSFPLRPAMALASPRQFSSPFTVFDPSSEIRRPICFVRDSSSGHMIHFLFAWRVVLSYTLNPDLRFFLSVTIHSRPLLLFLFLPSGRWAKHDSGPSPPFFPLPFRV